MRRGPQKSLKDFKFGTFLGHFPSDGEAITVVRGLKLDCLRKDRPTAGRPRSQWVGVGQKELYLLLYCHHPEMILHYDGQR